MANRNLGDELKPISDRQEADEQVALFRRAAQVTRTSQLLIREAEHLMAQSRKLRAKLDDQQNS